MLFLVPDAPPPDEKTAPEGNAPQSAPVGNAEVKVELDLDDAPFLDEGEPEPPTAHPSVPAEESPPELAADESKAKAGLLQRLSANKKLLVLAGGGLVLLGVVAVALLLFTGGEEGTPVPEPEEGPAPIIIVVNGTKETPTSVLPYAFLIEWEPFLVPLRGAEGEVRLLTCKLVIPVDEDILASEIEAKKVLLRDAVYYYLSRRPVTLLNTESAQKALRSDIVSVINERVTSAKIKDVFIQDYLVQGP